MGREFPPAQLISGLKAPSSGSVGPSQEGYGAAETEQGSPGQELEQRSRSQAVRPVEVHFPVQLQAAGFGHSLAALLVARSSRFVRARVALGFATLATACHKMEACFFHLEGEREVAVGE